MISILSDKIKSLFKLIVFIFFTFRKIEKLCIVKMSSLEFLLLINIDMSNSIPRDLSD